MHLSSPHLWGFCIWRVSRFKRTRHLIVISIRHIPIQGSTDHPCLCVSARRQALSRFWGSAPPERRRGRGRPTIVRFSTVRNCCLPCWLEESDRVPPEVLWPQRSRPGSLAEHTTLLSDIQVLRIEPLFSLHQGPGPSEIGFAPMKYALHFIEQAFHGVNNDQELSSKLHPHLGPCHRPRENLSNLAISTHIMQLK